MPEEVNPSATESFALYESNERSDLIAGIIVSVLAVVALAVSIWQSGIAAPFFGPTFAPRMVSLAMLLLGLGLITDKLDVKNPQDFYGGIALVGVAVVAMIASMSLAGMRGFVFGPATAPRLFAVLLALLGGLVVIMSLFVKGPQLERYTFRGTIFVLGAILIFAVTIRPLGLVAACFLTVLASAGATPEVRWKESVIWAAVLTAFCSVLFPKILGLPFLLWPLFWY